MTFTSCSMKEGATYDPVVAGLSAWAKLLGADLELVGNECGWSRTGVLRRFDSVPCACINLSAQI